MNIDGAVAKTQDKSDVRFVCRDELGRFQGASAVAFNGIIDPETLQAFACRPREDTHHK